MPTSTPTLTLTPRRPVQRGKRPLARRLLRDLSSVLVIAGVLMVIDAAVTLVWQEPVTALIGAIRQSHVDKRYLSYTSSPLSKTDKQALASIGSVDQRIAFLARREAASVPTAAAVGLLTIPKIGVSFDVVQGTGTASLERGPGHYPSTAFPGLGQTVAIAGHRTTYLAPFRNINELHAGDTIRLRMPYGTFVYAVQHQQVVKPNAWWITRNVGYERLVLSACNPLYSANQRIVVFARLKQVLPNMRALARA
jgi:sortase A